MKMGLLRIGIILVSALMTVWFIIPMFNGVINIGNIAGTLFFTAILAAALWYPQVKRFAGALWERLGGRIVLTAGGSFFCVALLFCIVVSALMISAMNRQPTGDATVVILGCKVNGEEPSLMLTKRLETAKEVLGRHETMPCVPSGGQGNGEDTSEAEAMEVWLKNQGVAPERIFIENQSTDTTENIRFSQEVIKKNGLPEEMLVVTDGFHQYRASLIAAKYGIKTSSASAESPWYLLPTYWARELFALAQEILMH